MFDWFLVNTIKYGHFPKPDSLKIKHKGVVSRTIFYLSWWVSLWEKGGPTAHQIVHLCGKNKL